MSYKPCLPGLSLVIVSFAMMNCDDQSDKSCESSVPSQVQEGHVYEKLNEEVVKELNDEVVRAMVSEHLDGIGENYSGTFDIAKARIEKIGGEYWLVSTVNRGVSHTSVFAWLVTRWGVHEVDSDGLTQAFTWLPPAENDSQKDELIMKYLSYLHLAGPVGFSGPGKIIESLHDIEGYEDNPLDSDLESTVCAPFTEGGNKRIFYRYHKLGGRLSRYRFHFDEAGKLKSVDILVLGKNIGDYIRLQ